MRVIGAVGDDSGIDAVGRNREINLREIGGIDEADGGAGVIVDVQARREKRCGVGTQKADLVRIVGAGGEGIDLGADEAVDGAVHQGRTRQRLQAIARAAQSKAA